MERGVAAALVVGVGGTGNLVAAVLLLAMAATIYWLIGRNLATIVTGREVAGIIALLFVVGFAQMSAVHNGAHDTRHANGFPCH